MVRKRFALLLAVLMLAVVVAGCGSKTNEPAPAAPAAGTEPSQPADASKPAEPEPPKLRVALVINGTLGDKGFFDSAARGVKQAGDELGIIYKIIEATYTASEWEPALLAAASSGDYDVVITGTWQMVDFVKNAAAQFPDVRFIIFDEATEGIPNVYSVRYAENEGSFLAGAFAALVSGSTELPNSKGAKNIGFVGGMDIPVINNFLVGYEQGAAYIDPATKVQVTYITNFDDAAKGKELALVQFSSGADISFNVAGGAGLGVLEASKEVGKYSIGVDMNQNPLYPGHTIVSMLKNVDVSLYRAIKKHIEGTLPYGTAETLGINEDGVGLEMDTQYVPQSIQDKVNDLIAKVKSGEIKVKSVFDE